MEKHEVTNKFYNKDGSLTPYGFACGYHMVVRGHRLLVEIYHDGCYNVRMFDVEKIKTITWNTFSKRTTALAYWFKLIKKFFNIGKKRALDEILNKTYPKENVDVDAIQPNYCWLCGAVGCYDRYSVCKDCFDNHGGE
jgi:hypothetical protein